MLALFSLLSPAYRGWKKLHTPEGVRLLFTLFPVRSQSASNTPLGPIQLTTYSGKSENSAFTTILSIRDFADGNNLTPEEMISSWRMEYDQSMQLAGVDSVLKQEEFLPGKQPRCNLLYTNEPETIFTRISLLTCRNRTVILFAVGKLDEISNDASATCFQSIRV